MPVDPSDLVTVAPDAPSAAALAAELGGSGPVLIEALDGFVDAGSARRIAREHLLAATDGQVVATFDADLLFDYRARRPMMVFERDHWASYEAPQLALHLRRDVQGRPFLVLSGPEPDVMWERFVTAVSALVERFGVRLMVGLNAIPMAVPHTRPVGVISHASQPGLIPAEPSWVATVGVPASAGHLLEYRLGTAGLPAVGFAVHVPHYVASAEYPAAAAELVRRVSDAGDLVLPTGPLDAAALSTRAAIDEQVAANAEVAAVVAALEGQYETFLAGRDRSLLVPDGQALPSADELAAELERFLAQQGGDPGPVG